MRAELKWRRKSGALRTFKWMMLNILSPEIVILKSLDEWVIARALHKKFHDLGNKVNRGWTLTHVIYSLMGGFALDRICDIMNG